MRSFVKIKSSRNGVICRLLTDIGLSYPGCEIFRSQEMSLNAIHENKILAKNSEFTVVSFSNHPQYSSTGPRSAVGNMSGNRCESDCRSRGREFDPDPVPYFRRD